MWNVAQQSPAHTTDMSCIEEHVACQNGMEKVLRMSMSLGMDVAARGWIVEWMNRCSAVF